MVADSLPTKAADSTVRRHGSGCPGAVLDSLCNLTPTRAVGAKRELSIQGDEERETHLAPFATTRHPGLDVKFATSRRAQFLCGHVEHSDGQAEAAQDVRLNAHEPLELAV